MLAAATAAFLWLVGGGDDRFVLAAVTTASLIGGGDNRFVYVSLAAVTTASLCFIIVVVASCRGRRHVWVHVADASCRNPGGVCARRA